MSKKKIKMPLFIYKTKPKKSQIFTVHITGKKLAIDDQ